MANKAKAKPASPKAGASPPDGEGEAGASGVEGEAGAKKKLSGKTLVLFILLPLVLILGGGGAAAFLLLQPKAHVEGQAHDEKKPKDKKHAAKGKKGDEKGADAAAGEIIEGEGGVFYYKMPEMLVNITSGDGRPAYLKLRLTLEAPDEEAVAALEPALPKVIDQYQMFLRELRVDDLAGSAGAYRLRLELLRRVNLAVAPTQVNAVLIEEMLVQ